MNRHFMVLFLACLLIQQATNANEIIGTKGYSRNDFVKDALGTHASKSDMEAPILFAMRYADGYIAGVVDATTGTDWCAPQRLKAGELDERVWSELQSQQERAPRVAAEVMLEFLIVKYPCGRTREKIAPRFRPNEFARDYFSLRELKGSGAAANVYKKTYVFGDPERAAIHFERYAAGYFDGAIEATTGTQWCPSPGVRAPNFHLGLISNVGSRKWPPLTNAAKAVVTELRKQFPCERRGTG